MSGRPGIDAAALGTHSWKEHAVRFVFGGVVTAVAGLIAHLYGPVIGGLFLAFPAILPATVTLVKNHDGRRAAVEDTGGAALGAVGMLAFGAVVWLLAERLAAWQVLGLAALAWLLVSAALWAIGHAAGDRRDDADAEAVRREPALSGRR
jgi:uncharacterized membrane protein (GlpM family)